MSDKKRFSDLIPDNVPPPIPQDAKACVNCAHARIEMNAAVMRTVVTCKALPKSPVAVPAKNGTGIQFFFPVMELHDECDLFLPRVGPGDDKPPSKRDENGVLSE